MSYQQQEALAAEVRSFLKEGLRVSQVNAAVDLVQLVLAAYKPKVFPINDQFLRVDIHLDSSYDLDSINMLKGSFEDRMFELGIPTENMLVSMIKQ